MSSLFSRGWLFRSARPRSRPRRRFAAPACHVGAAERLEARALLSAGDVLWSHTADTFAPTSDDYFADVAAQADGKVVAVGAMQVAGHSYDFFVARYTAAGGLDPTFGGGVGWATYDLGGYDWATAVAVRADGGIVVAGGTGADGGSAGIIRLGRDGALDASFGTGGKVVARWAPIDGFAYLNALALTADGRIVVGGQTVPGFPHGGGPESVIARYLADGTPDAAWGSGRTTLWPGQGVADLAVDADDRVVTVGPSAQVARFTASGGLDPTFDGDGMRDVSLGPSGVAIDAAGRIVVTGEDISTDGFGVVRLLPDGRYDGSFGGDGRALLPEAFGTSRDVAILPNGAVVVGGQTAAGALSVAVLTSSGSPDAAFGGDGVAVADVTAGGDPGGGSLAVTSAGNYAVVGRAGGDAAVKPQVAAFTGRYARRDDLLGMAASGDWYVAASTGSGFGNGHFGTWAPAAGWRLVDSADFNGDGLKDVAGRDASGLWWVGFNTGSGFATAAAAQWNEAAGWRDVRFADFDGDGRADVAGRTSYGEWWVSRATGTGLADGVLWDAWNEAAGWRDVIAADFSGDGRADLAGRTGGGGWWVSASNGASFSPSLWDAWNEAAGWRDVRAGDFDGDGRADLAGRTSTGGWWASRSTGTAFSQSLWERWNEAAGWRDVVVGDFDGDGKDDLAGRTAAGQWYVGRGVGVGFVTSRWGVWNEAAAWREVRVGDFDGDGRSDLAGRASDGEWWVGLGAGNAFATSHWGSWNEAAGWKTVAGEFALV